MSSCEVDDRSGEAGGPVMHHWRPQRDHLHVAQSAACVVVEVSEPPLLVPDRRPAQQYGILTARPGHRLPLCGENGFPTGDADRMPDNSASASRVQAAPEIARSPPGAIACHNTSANCCTTGSGRRPALLELVGQVA